MADKDVFRRRLGGLGALVLGAVLLVGAASKAVDPKAFAEQIEAEGLDAFLSADTVALVALGLELALGTALVLGVRRLWVLVPAGILVAFFVFLTGRSYWNDAHGIADPGVSCGCFGNLVDRTPAEAFWQDVVLLVPALGLAFVGRQRSSLPVFRMVLAGLVAVTGVGFAGLAPQLPLDDLATRLRAGRAVGQICSGSGEHRVCLTGVIPELGEGEHVVVMADLSSPDFGQAVKDLNRYHLSGKGPALWVLTASSPEEHHRFFWQWAPSFPILDAPRALIRPLYRELPRSFMVSDGQVIRTFSGLPPLEELAPGPEI